MYQNSFFCNLCLNINGFQSFLNYLTFMVLFINDNHIRPFCSYKMVCLYSKIATDFTSVIRNDRSWLMFIPFWFNMDSIWSTNFQINMPSNSIMPSFILFLSKFGTFSYNVVNCLISHTTHFAFRFLL